MAPFRKRSRSDFLFGCKRPHDENLSLPTFCGACLRHDLLLHALRAGFEHSAHTQLSRVLGAASLNSVVLPFTIKSEGSVLPFLGCLHLTPADVLIQRRTMNIDKLYDFDVLYIGMFSVIKYE